MLLYLRSKNSGVLINCKVLGSYHIEMFYRILSRKLCLA